MTELENTPAFGPCAGWRILRLRAELLARLRTFFDQHGFLEVETPILSAAVVVERHLEPFRTTLVTDRRRPEDGQSLWLQTSPESEMKRLMAAGGEAIYQVTRSFRNGERGRCHNPEFTMVEWYRRGDTMDGGMRLLSELCEALLNRGPADRISYQEAFLRYAHVDPLMADTRQLAASARDLEMESSLTLSDPRDDWLDLLLVERVEPNLGRNRPVILFDYPASQAALANVRDEEIPIAERFELYVDGIELANGYHELTDAEELRRRFRQANRQRADEGRLTLPENRRLLAALESGLPECTGVAFGFDRLVMVAAGADSIADVMAFPIDRV